MTEATGGCPLDVRGARRRFLILVGLRWLPTGFLIPVMVLLPLSRGLSLTQIGLVFSVQGLVVLALELPTGGLSDALGRRPTLLVASVISLISLGILYSAHSAEMFVVAIAVQGVYRALDSGPVEAWYVDTTLMADPDAKIEGGLGGGTAVLSIAIASGALMSGGLVALDPFPAIETLALPLIAAFLVGVIYFVAILALMREERAARGVRAMAASVRAVPRTVGDGMRLLRGSRVLAGLIGVELFWGFSMVTFESLFPVRMSEVVGDTDRAAALMGPISSAAWFVSAAGAGVIVFASRRIGIAPAAAATRILQGLSIVGMGLLAGPIGLVAAYFACYFVHGAANPLHAALLHRQADGANRNTVLSMNSMVSQPAGAAGAIVLSALADGTSLSIAMIAGGIVCALAAPLYLPSWRQEQRRAASEAGAVSVSV